MDQESDTLQDHHAALRDLKVIQMYGPDREIKRGKPHSKGSNRNYCMHSVTTIRTGCNKHLESLFQYWPVHFKEPLKVFLACMQSKEG
jgi:hypothetical protein